MTHEGLNRANMTNQMLSESQNVLPGSRLNLNHNDSRKLEMMYSDASNYARKKYGGNTQYRYRTSAAQPIDDSEKRNYF